MRGIWFVILVEKVFFDFDAIDGASSFLGYVEELFCYPLQRFYLHPVVLNFSEYLFFRSSFIASNHIQSFRIKRRRLSLRREGSNEEG